MKALPLAFACAALAATASSNRRSGVPSAQEVCSHGSSTICNGSRAVRLEALLGMPKPAIFRTMKALPLAFACAALAATASAQPGTLDPTFGNGGVATFTLDDVWVPATDILPMPDGDNLVVSISRDDQYIDRMLLMRLNPDGSLDNAFGQNGKVRWSPGSLGMRAQGSKLLPDGKLLVCGNLINGNQLATAALYRFNADGTPDTSFGTNGRTLIPHVDGNDNLYWSNPLTIGQRVVGMSKVCC
jgi:uncharacterized delta-60 repeat protein